MIGISPGASSPSLASAAAASMALLALRDNQHAAVTNPSSKGIDPKKLFWLSLGGSKETAEAETFLGQKTP